MPSIFVLNNIFYWFIYRFLWKKAGKSFRNYRKFCNFTSKECSLGVFSNS